MQLEDIKPNVDYYYLIYSSAPGPSGDWREYTSFGGDKIDIHIGPQKRGETDWGEDSCVTMLEPLNMKNWWIVHVSDIFETFEEAQARADELMAEKVLHDFEVGN